jgi:hypothetical protein
MINRTVYSFLFLTLLGTLGACKNSSQEEGSRPENDVDAARMFIRYALDGDYSKAKQLLVQDSTNLEFLDALEHNYQTRMSREDKRGYRESSINMHDVSQKNDSITIVKYSNSYKNQKDSVKVVRKGGEWLIDLKYSFLPADSVKK